MTTDKAKTYELYSEKERLIFRTSSFRAEKTSVLHAGVYTKEFSSMLAASAASVLAYILMNNIMKEAKSSAYVTGIASFVAVFLVSRKFIFRDACLEADFNSARQTVSIRRPGFLYSKSEEIPFHSIRSVEIGSRRFTPENMDGIQFVQKISAQHGSVVPGLDETEEFIMMKLMLTDGTERILYAAKLNGGKVHGEPEIPLNEIRRFLEHSSSKDG